MTDSETELFYIPCVTRKLEMVLVMKYQTDVLIDGSSEVTLIVFHVQRKYVSLSLV